MQLVSKKYIIVGIIVLIFYPLHSSSIRSYPVLHTSLPGIV